MNSCVLCNKWTTIIGCALLLFPYGHSLYWGNMYVYCASYLLNHVKEESGVQAPWVMMLKILANPVACFGTAFLIKVVGKRRVLFFGIFLTFSSFFTSYWSVQESNTLLALTFGLVFGLAEGIVLPICLQYSIDWSDSQEGLYSSIIRLGQYIGAIGTGYFVTAYVNPNNLSPDLRSGPSVFFSQEEVLDRVPSTFLVLSGVFAAFQLVGFFMLRDKEDVTKAITTDDDHGGDNDYGSLNGYGSPYNDGSPELLDVEGRLTITQELVTIDTVAHDTVTPLEVTPSHTENNMTMKEIIRNSQFYTLGLSFMSASISYTVADNYYKSFGQTWIHDDIFLTSVGSATPIFTILTVMLWGVVMDKYGVKRSLMFLFASLAVVESFYYFTPMVNPWLYSATTVLFGGIISPIYGIYNVACVKVFGKESFVRNFGAILSFSIVSSLACPPILELVYLRMGWFYFFMLTAWVNLVTLVYILFGLK